MTGQEGLVRERESPSEDASSDQTLLPSSLGSLRRVQERSKVLPMLRDQEDSDQREPTESEPPSPSESRMTQGNVLSEDPLPRPLMLKRKPKRKLSISHPRFRDSSLTRGLEERCSIRDLRKTDGKPPEMLTSPTRSSSPNSLRRRRLPTRTLTVLNQHQ